MTENSFSSIRAAQCKWAAATVAQRIKILRAARRIVAARAAEFADSVQLPGRRNSAETLPMEVIPLLDAMRFLERNAVRILRPDQAGVAGRPMWLWSVRARTRRAPMGIVLVIGPFNYPLFLPGVQVLQALAAGNAVVVKPAPDSATPMHLLADCLASAGLPAHLLTVLDTDVSAVEHAFAAGVDKVILTGSAKAGNAVMHMAADHAVPSVMELSGNDAVLLHPDCDIAMAVSLLAYGLRLNGGATCIAPRRVFVPAGLFDQVAVRLAALVAGMPAMPVAPGAMAQAVQLLDEARGAGGVVHGGVTAGAMIQPALVIDPPAQSGLLDADLFAPVMSLIRYSDINVALGQIAASRYCLSVSIFAPRRTACELATSIQAGTVVINDIIVPTADPRLPFEASGSSGFGATRGADGLLAMTRATTRIVRYGRARPHASHAIATGDALFFIAYIDTMYSAPRNLVRSAFRLVAEAIRMARR